MATDTGTRIKRARERKRWTQRQLADALGVNIKTVDNWENGRTSPRNSVGAIEEILGVDLSEEQPEPPPDPIPQDLRDLIRRNFPPERAERLLDVMEGLLTGRLTVAGPGEPAGGRDPRRETG